MYTPPANILIWNDLLRMQQEAMAHGMDEDSAMMLAITRKEGSPAPASAACPCCGRGDFVAASRRASIQPKPAAPKRDRPGRYDPNYQKSYTRRWKRQDTPKPQKAAKFVTEPQNPAPNENYAHTNERSTKRRAVA